MTKRNSSSVLLTAAMALAVFGATPAHAQLLGTTVTGNLSLPGNNSNFFDPANGFVPSSGYSNSTGGTTVTVAEPAIEFGFASGNILTITANITATQLILTEVINNVDSPAGFTMTLNDTSFGTPVLVSNTFPSGFSFSKTGNIITVNGPANSTNGTYQATLNVAATAVPESGSGVLALLAASGSLFVAKLRRRKTA